MSEAALDALKTSLLFRKDWEAYQGILSGDCMYHSCLYAALQQFLETRYKGPFRMLDLGCGDSDFLSRMLNNSPLLTNNMTVYTGIDMSAPALSLSQNNMSQALPPSATIQYHEQDMLGFMECCQPQSYDVILASFSVHHLSADQKQQLLQTAGCVLARGGCFCLVDIFLETGESRSDHLERYEAAMATWITLDTQQQDRILNHVTQYDYPELVATYGQWLQEVDSSSKLNVLCERGQLFKAVAMEFEPSDTAACDALVEPLEGQEVVAVQA